MREVWKSASFWYWSYVVAIFVIWQTQESLNLIFDGDAGSYSWNPETLLSGYRTIGYPVFLKLVSLLPFGTTLLPSIQFFAYSLSIFVLLIGLCQFEISRLKVLIVALPMYHVQFAKEYIPRHLPEALTVSFSVLTFGLLLILVANPRNRLNWLLVGISLFCTYQVRPAFLFMIPLVPILGTALWFLHGRTVKRRIVSSRFFTYLVALAIMPLLAFSAFRFAAVGHFGLVSFGGFNIVGIASQMLHEETVDELPASDQQLGLAIIEQRYADTEILADPEEYPETHPRYNVISDGTHAECTRPLPMDYRNWVNCYNYHIWRLAAPIALKQSDGNVIVANEKLKSLSRNTVLTHPDLYVAWFSNALKDTLLGTLAIDRLIRLSSSLLTGVLILDLMSRFMVSLLSRFLSQRTSTWVTLASVASFLIIGFVKIEPLRSWSLRILIVDSVYKLLDWSLPLILTYFLISSFIALFAVKFTQWKSPAFWLIKADLPLLMIALGNYVFGFLLFIAVEPPMPRYIMAVYTLLPSAFLLYSYSVLSRLITEATQMLRSRTSWV